MDDRWIEIPNWDGPEGFQHYADRDPIWIKNYRRLMAKDEYLTLSFHCRGILHGLWLEYAASNRQIRDNTLTLTRRLGGRVTRRDLESLNHAGFIEFVASKPLATCYPSRASREQSREEVEKDLKTPDQELGLDMAPTGLDDLLREETLEELAARLTAGAAVPGTIERLFEVLPDMDTQTPTVIRQYAQSLRSHEIEAVREEVIHKHPNKPSAYTVALLKKRANGRRR